MLINKNPDLDIKFKDHDAFLILTLIRYALKNIGSFNNKYI